MDEEYTPQNDGIELLNATQNAVIEAVDNVSDLITETHQPEQTLPVAHHEIFYKEAEFWVGFAFILVVVALAKPVGSALKKMLVKYRDDIENEINQAEKLQDDAQELLARYERQYINVGKETQAILDKAERQINANRAEQTAKTDAELLQKTRETEQLIAAAQAGILSEINSKTATKAVQTAGSYLKGTLSSADQERLIDDSIERILTTARTQS